MRGVSVLAGSANISARPRASSRILIRRGSVTSRTLSSTASSSCSRGCWKRRLSAQRWRRSARRFSASARLMSASRALAKASRGAAVFSFGLFGGFCRLRRRRTGCAAATLLAVFSSARTLAVGAAYWWRSRIARSAAAASVCGCGCGCGSCAGAAAGFVAATRAHRLRWCRRDGYRLRRHPAFQLGDRLRRRVGDVRSQIATAETGGDRHDHGSHACKISRRYPHGSAPSFTRATRGMGRCSGTAW